jgi:hypothetical protein
MFPEANKCRQKCVDFLKGQHLHLHPPPADKLEWHLIIAVHLLVTINKQFQYVTMFWNCIGSKIETGADSYYWLSDFELAIKLYEESGLGRNEKSV